ncbi:MAG: oligosaccharide flippase family protein [Dysgonamonadaceae bacterium]|jgi:O-antigen/teichoic acid export membrane protein|nr:oligosaccharide flippase family protein [Dysgonamonadaceae bacterium]
MISIKRIEKICSSEFFKYSATLLSANAISQVISILAYPFITRIYGPNIFGIFSLFITICSILTLITTGKYELAMVLPKSDKQVKAIFQLTLLLNGFFFILLVGTVLVWRENIAAFFHRPELSDLLLLLPLFVLLSGFWWSLKYLLIRQKKYGNISIYNLTQSGVATVSKCIFGLQKATNILPLRMGLAGGQLFGLFTATLTSVILGRKMIREHCTHWNKADIKQVAKAYSNLPKYELPTELLNVFVGNLPVLLLSMYFGETEIGLFALALNIGISPVTLFSGSVFQVLFRRMSEHVQNRRPLKPDCIRFCKFCLWGILPFFIIFTFAPESFFVMLFGSKWLGLGFYLKLLFPFLFLVVLTVSLGGIPDIFFKQKTVLNIEIISVIFRIIALAIGVYYHNFNLAIVLFCAVSAAMMFVKLVWYFHLVKKYESSLL